jgi:predicted O-methyltransferase YrrM
LNSRLAQRARIAGRFADFLLHSGNRYRVHSPFLYEFIGNVIRSGKPVDEASKIEQLRKECKKSKEIIEKTDYGVGGVNSIGKPYPVALRHLVATSLTSPRQARRLYRLTKYMKPGRILEIGTSLGITTSYLACANPESRIITLEGCPELSRKAREHFRKLGIKNAEVMEGRFEDTLSKALDMLGGIDFVFIDGNHRKEAVLDYYAKCLAFSNNDTIMVIDDIHSTAEMEQAWEQIRQMKDIRISLDFFFSGWIFFRKESSKQHFRLRYI